MERLVPAEADEGPEVVERPTEAHRPPKRTVTLLPLVSLIFFNVSGGPYGTEQTVGAGGPLYSLIGFTVYPFLWAVPYALTTAELATMFPADGGYSLWVQACFGDFWGYTEGFLIWVSGVADSALYPSLVISYCENLGGGWIKSRGALVTWALKAAMVFGSFILNILGVEAVGGVMVLLNIFVLLPFALLSGYALSSGVRPKQWLQTRPAREIRWIDFMNSLYWNLSGWGNVGSFAGEVRNPNKTFPAAMVLAAALVIVTYTVPMAMGTGTAAGRDVGAWTEGHYQELSQALGGPWLSSFMVAGAAASMASMLVAEMCQDSYQLYGMAENGLLPAALTRRIPRLQTPWLSTALCFAVVLFLSSFDFGVVVQVDNLMNCAAMILQNVAFLYLRWKHPDAPRPYAAPLPGVLGGLAMVAPPTLVGLLTLVSMDTGVMVASACTLCAGWLFWVVLAALKSRDAARFMPSYRYRD